MPKYTGPAHVDQQGNSARLIAYGEDYISFVDGTTGTCAVIPVELIERALEDRWARDSSERNARIEAVRGANLMEAPR